MNTSHTETLSENKKFSFIEKFFKVQPEDNIGRLSFFLRILLVFVVMSLFAYICTFILLATKTLGQVSISITLLIQTIIFVLVFFVFRPLVIKRLRNMGYEAKIPNILLWTYFVISTIFCFIVIVANLLGESFFENFSPESLKSFAYFIGYYAIYLSQSRIWFFLILIILCFIPSKKNAQINSSEK